MRHSILLILLLGVIAGGCASSEETTREQTATGADVRGQGFTPHPMAEDVRTVQLYRSGAEASLPVIALGSGQTLTLEFDLLDDGRGGPVSVHFFHTDRFWNQRLMPLEYMRGFQSDGIRDYESSSGTRVRYTHYRYDFPNDVIDFTRSGNFVIRVTELGDDQAVLLERAFLITEDDDEVDPLRPSSFFPSAIHDVDICYLREGRFELTRCSNDPTLVGASLHQFLIRQERELEGIGPRYDLDLSILGAGPRIEAVDLAAEPYQVLLQTDDPRFAEAFYREELLTGQPIIRTAVGGALSPAIRAEYVETTFRLEHLELEPMAGRVFLSGSFNGWEVNPAYEMLWDEEAGLYVGTFLVKQGLHGYRYHVDDPAAQAHLRRSVDLGRPTLYTALVYLHDPAYDTDRLLSVQSVTVR